MSKTTFKVIGGVVLAFLLLGVGLKLLKVVTTIFWWFIVIPLLGSVIGLAITFVIKRVILPEGSPHRDNPALTTGAFVAGWSLVLLSSCT